MGPLLAQGSIGQSIDQLLKPYVSSNNFSGTVCISRSGKVIYEKSFGMAAAEWNILNSNNAVYHLASVSKPFTATAILLLEQQGKLSTADPVSKYLPAFNRGSEITIHHLLCHTSGIPNINDFPEYNLLSLTAVSLDSIVKVFQNRPLQFEPGSKFSYSNSNYNVLALIIEKTSGMKYGDFLKKNIFDKLDMKSTIHHGDVQMIIANMASGYAPVGQKDFKRSPYLDWSSKTGNGSLCSTAGDLAKFDRGLMDETVLTAASKKKMFSPNLSDVGYGWYLRKHNNRSRSYMTGRSPGFCSYFARYPDEQVSVIVLSNLYVSSTKEIGESVASILHNESFSKRKLEDGTISADEGNQFKGIYQFGDDFFRPDLKMEITVVDGHLACSFGELIRDTKDGFVLRSFWSSIAFERDASQKITGLTFDGMKARRVN
ncbi:MAG TPA: serine hydrolase domain-containing protein [Cyclobacteriaceae bacterium]|nr:serine hydrolase domain-containing protein [Cyclobacteriaceae bacterium]